MMINRMLRDFLSVCLSKTRPISPSLPLSFINPFFLSDDENLTLSPSQSRSRRESSVFPDLLPAEREMALGRRAK